MKKLVYISLYCFLFSGFSLWAQTDSNIEKQKKEIEKTRKALQQKRNKLQKDIKKAEKILSKTKAQKTDALGDLKDLNQKISMRENLIETIALESVELSKEIKKNEKRIVQNNKELAVLKEDYASMVRKSYKSKSQQSKTMFLLSSKSFLQAYKRLKYMEQYKSFRKKQGEEIVAKTKFIKQLNDSLDAVKKVKKRLLVSEKEEKKQIETEKKDQEKLVSKIKKQESKYKRQLRKNIREEKRITARINKVIEKAITLSNKGKKGAKKGKLVLSAEEKTLKANFEQNRGVLPSPLKGGVVTRRFGVQPHPTFKSIKINSTGLHIRGKKGDVAKSVFNGKVLVVQLLSKGRKSVFVQHGNYITAYNNLAEVYVKKGDKIKTGQKLGKIFTNKVTGKTSLLFVLSENTKKLDPQDWIDMN